MSSQKDRMAAECFRKGNDAVNKGDWDMAEAMFSTCVKLKPGLLNYRQLLRNSTKKKYKDNGKGKGTFGAMTIRGIRSKMSKAKTAEQWEEVSKLAEEGLLVNPWDPQLNVELAEASKQLDRSEIARMAYFDACKGAPKDKALHIALATHLRERHEFDEAIKVWERIQAIDPKDMEARRMIAELHGEKGIKTGRYEEAEDTKGVMVDKKAFAKAGQTMAPGEDVETDLRHAIRREPDKLEHYLKLAAHLRNRKQFEKSVEVFQQALEISGNDPNVREQMEDAELLLLKHGLDLAKEKANESEDADDRKQVAELSNAFRERRIEVLTAREVRYPANLGLKLELATLLMQLQDWGRSIPLLQKAATDPRLKTKALVNLGKCFVYDKKNALARSQFEKAIPDLSAEKEPDTYKECLYLLGRVCEDMGDAEAAEEHYGQVIVLDYHYKDALKRMESLQAAR